MKAILASLASLLLVMPMFAAEHDRADNIKRIHESAMVLHEILNAGDKTIPEDLLSRAQCVGIVPNLKRVGFVVGAKYGKGIVTCRVNEGRGWSAPSTILVEGGSIGLQIGAGETDVVFIVTHRSGMDKLMADKFTIGADAAAMAGPVGRSTSADTDVLMKAEILSYSRAHGVFAGVSLQGATLSPDHDDNRILYGPGVTQREILTGRVRPPRAADALFTELNRYAPFKKG